MNASNAAHVAPEAVYVSVLSPHDRGELRHEKPIEVRKPEGFFALFVEHPTNGVANLIGAASADWSKEETRIVAGLATATEKSERDALKAQIPALVPARFAGSRRLGAECLGRQIIGHDFDRVEGATFEDACAAVRAQLPDRFLALHTTATERNADGTWRLRAYEILDREATREEWDVRVKPHMRAVGEHDPNALDVARLLYMPIKTAGYRWRVYEGPRTRLDDLEAAPRPAASSEPIKAASTPVRDTSRAAAVAMLAAVWPERGNGRHAAQRALAGGLCRNGWSETDALDVLCDVCRRAGDEDRPKREATIRDTWQRAGRREQFAAWGALRQQLGATVVDVAESLLHPDVDLFREIEEELNAEAANDSREPAGLGFVFGGWEEEPPPIEFLIDDLVPRECVGMIFGRADSLKTWMVFSQAIAVARGEPWLGRMTKQARVAIVDFETGSSNMRRRLFRLRAGDCGGRLAWRSFPTLKPNDPEFWRTLARDKFDLVYVDSLRKANPGANENDSAEAIKPLELAAEFSEATKCAVIYIHHAKKSSDDGWPDFRGSAAIEDQVDVAFAVRKLDTKDPDTKRVEVRCDKPGDMRKPDDFAVEVQFDDVNKVTTVREADPEDAGAKERGEVKRAKIRNVLAGGPQPNVRAIERAANAGSGALGDEIARMFIQRELVKLPGVGIVLDNPVARLERIRDAASDCAYRTDAELAKAASVDADEVRRAALEGHIVKSGNRYMQTPSEE